MCEWLEVSTAGYSEWRDRPVSGTSRRRDWLTLLIVKAFDDSDETYGHRRIHAQLVRWGVRCTLELVRAVMRDLGLVPCQPRPWRHGLTEADPGAGPISDLLGRDFTADAPVQKMVGDTTYIPTWEGWSTWRPSSTVTLTSVFHATECDTGPGNAKVPCL
jgi:transposase InsO family protein